MDFSIPVPQLGFDIIAQIRFFTDRHMIIITDSVSKSHGTLVQVDASIDDSIAADLHSMNVDDNEDGGDLQQKKKEAENNDSKLPPLAFEITPLLGSERDNQWMLLVARRLTTVISEVLMLRQLGSGTSSTGSGLSAAMSPILRNFNASVVLMIHVPAAFKKDENMRYSFDVIKKLEAQIKERLM